MRPSGYQDGAEVIDVGLGWTGLDEVSQRLKKRVGIVIGEEGAGIEAFFCRTPQRVGPDNGTCIVFGAVDAVGIARDGINPRMAIEGDGEGQEKLCIRTAAASRARLAWMAATS